MPRSLQPRRHVYNPQNNGGGGIRIGIASPTIRNNIITGNTGNSGGGILMSGASYPDIINNVISFNSAEDQRGGGIYVGGFSSPNIIGNLIFSNTAGRGGGVHSRDLAGPVSLVNNTIVYNMAGSVGGVDILGDPATATNCIIWGNSGLQIVGQVTVTYSDVQGGASGTGNIDVDPLFVDAAGDDYHLAPGSRCIDAGDNTALPDDTLELEGECPTATPVSLDLDNEPRFVDDPLTTDTGNQDPFHPVVDIGAYEYQAAPVVAAWYVDDDAPNDPGPWNNTISDPLEDGSLQHPFDEVQESISVASDGDTIVVLPGTYDENIDLLDKNIRLTSSGGAARTTLTQTAGGPVVTMNGYQTNSTELQGFTIEGGTGVPTSYGPLGGGVFCGSAAPVISKCIIKNNFAQVGGGIFLHAGQVASTIPAIVDCRFNDNVGAVWGGGLAILKLSSVADGWVDVRNCSFYKNGAAQGGGVAVIYLDPGLIPFIGFPVFQNVVIANNAATQFGGGIFSYNISTYVANCTIYGNTAGAFAGGIFSYDPEVFPPDPSGWVFANNTIVWNNGESPWSFLPGGVVTYSVLEGFDPKTPGMETNLDIDPGLSDPDCWDFHLSSSSPCVDGGFNGGLFTIVPLFDFEGDARPLDGDGDGEAVTDIGCDEFVP